MTRCAWCGSSLAGRDPDAGPVSHGICRSCLVDVEYRKQSLSDLLARLPRAAMALDRDCRVVGTTDDARGHSADDRPVAVARLAGEVLSCIYAEYPGGCGRTEHCVGCTIRTAVERTADTGTPLANAPAFGYVATPDGPSQVWYRISTERLGAVVLLRIEEAGPAPAGGAGPRAAPGADEA